MHSIGWVLLLPDGDTGHWLEPLLTGRQGRGACPEVNQVLLLHGGHLLYDSPQPSLEGDQPIIGLATLVVEGGVAYEHKVRVKS